MMRIAMVVLAVVTMAGCGGGGDPDVTGQDFSGDWTLTVTGVANVDSPCGATDVQIGATSVNTMTISQNGSALYATLTLNYGTLAGAGTATETGFKLTLLQDGGAALIIDATALDANSATGTWKRACEEVTYSTVIATFTMTK